MMSDLVERLRTPQMDGYDYRREDLSHDELWAVACAISRRHWILRREAAAEIERLRAYCQNIVALKRSAGDELGDAVQYARAALSAAPDSQP